jgi:hypothetical protein
MTVKNFAKNFGGACEMNNKSETKKSGAAFRLNRGPALQILENTNSDELEGNT